MRRKDGLKIGDLTILIILNHVSWIRILTLQSLLNDFLLISLRIFMIFHRVFVTMVEGELLHQLFTYEEKASRIELFVRIVYWILIGIVLWVYGFIAGICWLIQWFVILILGRRSKALGEFVRGYMEYYVHVANYMYFFTDMRPAILPEPVKIFEEWSNRPSTPEIEKKPE
jgi:hypothetical protein